MIGVSFAEILKRAMILGGICLLLAEISGCRRGREDDKTNPAPVAKNEDEKIRLPQIQNEGEKTDPQTERSR